MKNTALYQYLVVIPPSRSVNQDVMNMKNWCMTANGWDAPKFSKPHFTVCQFVQPSYNEERITKKLQRLSESFDPFTIILTDFNSFQKATNTIYLCVENEKRFSEIPLYLKKHLKPLLTPVRDYSPRFIEKGHLTIAKHIPKKEFNKAWPYWKNMKYHAESDANQILLLRKRLSPAITKFNPYKTIGSFPFLGKGIPDLQFTLF